MDLQKKCIQAVNQMHHLQFREKVLAANPWRYQVQHRVNCSFVQSKDMTKLFARYNEIM